MTDNSFVLKNLLAQEISLSVGCERYGFRIYTIGDLREFVKKEYQLPKHLQNYVCGGTRYDQTISDKTPLDGILDKARGEDRETYIWLIWMSHDDYYSVTDRAFIAADELESKRSDRLSRSRPFETISIPAYLQLCERTIDRYLRYQDSNR